MLADLICAFLFLSTQKQKVLSSNWFSTYNIGTFYFVSARKIKPTLCLAAKHFSITVVR